MEIWEWTSAAVQRLIANDHLSEKATTRPSGSPSIVSSEFGIRQESPGHIPDMIGIGAAVACRPLPHHRANGSVHGGSRSYASSSRITKEDRASGSMHWKARQKGLWRGPGTRGHDHCQQCWLPVACVPQAATTPPDDGAWSSTAARGRIE